MYNKKQYNVLYRVIFYRRTLIITHTYKVFCDKKITPVYILFGFINLYDHQKIVYQTLQSTLMLRIF